MIFSLKNPKKNNQTKFNLQMEALYIVLPFFYYKNQNNYITKEITMMYTKSI